jgi:hypothetical protein
MLCNNPRRRCCSAQKPTCKKGEIPIIYARKEMPSAAIYARTESCAHPSSISRVVSFLNPRRVRRGCIRPTISHRSQSAHAFRPMCPSPPWFEPLISTALLRGKEDKGSRSKLRQDQVTGTVFGPTMAQSRNITTMRWGLREITRTQQPPALCAGGWDFLDGRFDARATNELQSISTTASQVSTASRRAH